MSSTLPGMTSAKDFKNDPVGWQERWLRELTAAKKTNKKWKENAKKITKVFLDERADAIDNGSVRLNVFSANIVTLRAMLFGQTPRVDISRRFQDAHDDAARVASEMLERILNSDVAEEFSYSIGMSLDDRLLMGLGIARVAYDADFESIQHEAITTSDGFELAPAFEEEKKTFEAAPVYYVNWRDVEWSPARSWDEVRWVAFKAYLTQDQCVERFGEKIGKAIPLGQANSKRSTLKGGIEDDPWQKAEVWEVWNLDDKTVYWINEGMDVICDKKEDTLQLRGFFPCPKFMLANPTSEKYQPRADYILAQDQYEEVNQVTTRIVLLEKAIKCVGVYDKSSDGVQRMMNEGVDNTLIPVDNWAMFAEKGGIKGQIDWLPVEDIAKALQILRDYRTELVNLLFQVTGMSDIMRGSTQSGETATAQSIKAKFASVRVQFMQDEFARFATDLQQLRAEVIVTHFDDETIIEQSNMKGTPDEEHIPAALELLRHLKGFRISIKSEQLAAQDMAALRQEKMEFVQGLSGFITASAPLVQQHPAAAPVLLEMLKWAMTGFKGGSTIEGVLDKAIAQLQQNPPEPPKDPNEQKAKAAEALQGIKLKGDAAREQIKTQGKFGEIQAQTAADVYKINVESGAEMQKQAAQFAFDTRENQRAQATSQVNELTRANAKSQPKPPQQQ